MSVVFLMLTAVQVLIFDWIAGSTRVNSPERERGFNFCALSVARRGYTAILHHRKFLHSQRFSCSGGKRCGRSFVSAFCAGLNPV